MSAAECRRVEQMVLPESLPPARGNRYADDERAAQLGYRIFYNDTFSSPAGMACATCHMPEKGFNDHLPVSRGRGSQPVTRNAPSVLNAAWLSVFFWDGHADTLWSQPIATFENPQEMHFSRLELAAKVGALFGPQYRAIFGPLPPLADSRRFPFVGKPGDTAWEAMTVEDRDAINRVAANVGKAIEAFLRKLVSRRAPFDEFLLGTQTQLADGARLGIRAFVAAGCLDCHSGPMLTDEKFHRLQLPTPAAVFDRGRAGGIDLLLASPFNSRGSYYDRANGEQIARLPVHAARDDEAAFRTPSLRNLALSAPYGHDGRYATLFDLVRAHAPPRIDDAQVRLIVAFLNSLSGQLPPLPWSNWPGA